MLPAAPTEKGKLTTSPRKSIVYADPTHKKFLVTIPSKIPDDMRVISTSPIKPDRTYESEFDATKKQWNIVMFPRKYPDSREDVIFLENWLTARLADAANFQHSSVSKEVNEGEESIVKSIKQIDILNFGFSEVIRQVSTHCEKRGQLIQRMWHSSHDLFNKVYRDMSTIVRQANFKSTEKTAKIEHLKLQLSEMQMYNNDIQQEMEKIKNEKTSSVEEDLPMKRRGTMAIAAGASAVSSEDKAQQKEHAEALSLWFPNFEAYGHSILRNCLPTAFQEETEQRRQGKDRKGSLAGRQSACTLPQVLLLQDIQRLSKYKLVDLEKEAAKIALMHQHTSDELSKTVTSEGETEPQSSHEKHMDENYASIVQQCQLRELESLQWQKQYTVLKRESDDQINMLEKENLELKRLVSMFQEHAISTVRPPTRLSELNNQVMSRRPDAQKQKTHEKEIKDVVPLVLLYSPSLDEDSKPLWSIFKIQSEFFQVITHLSTLVAALAVRRLVVTEEQAFLKKINRAAGKQAMVPNKKVGHFSAKARATSVVNEISFHRLMFQEFCIRFGNLEKATVYMRNMIQSTRRWRVVSHENNAKVLEMKSASSAGRRQRRGGGVPMPQTLRTIQPHERHMLDILAVMLQIENEDEIPMDLVAEKEKPLDTVTSNSGKAVAGQTTEEDFDYVTKIRCLVMDDLFSRGYAAMKQYLTKSFQNAKIAVAAPFARKATDILIPGWRCNVPVGCVVLILQRIFQCELIEVKDVPVEEVREGPPNCASYRVVYHRAGGILPPSMWWSCLPASRLKSLQNSLEMLAFKNSVEFVQMFDTILTCWSACLDHYQALRLLLIRLYRFLLSVSGSSSADTSLFYVLLAGVIGEHSSGLLMKVIDDPEQKDKHEEDELSISSHITAQIWHCALIKTLTAEHFADIILSSGCTCLQMHSLFNQTLHLFPRDQMLVESGDMLHSFEQDICADGAVALNSLLDIFEKKKKSIKMISSAVITSFGTGLRKEKAKQTAKLAGGSMGGSFLMHVKRQQAAVDNASPPNASIVNSIGKKMFKKHELSMIVDEEKEEDEEEEVDEIISDTERNKDSERVEIDMFDDITVTATNEPGSDEDLTSVIEEDDGVEDFGEFELFVSQCRLCFDPALKMPCPINELFFTLLALKHVVRLKNNASIIADLGRPNDALVNFSPQLVSVRHYRHYMLRKAFRGLLHFSG